MRSRRFVLTLLLVTACGGKVAIDQTAAGSGGAGGSECGHDGMPIPATYKTCSADEECTIKLVYIDCCGKRALVGAAVAQLPFLASYLHACNSIVADCACDPGPAQLDDGSTSSDADAIHVVCAEGQCMTRVD